jgi:multidrug efflux pump subunit AcrB
MYHHKGVFQMSPVLLTLIAVSATVVVAGLSLALYASLPQKFFSTANSGRYAGLTATAPMTTSADKVSAVQIGSLQEHSA